jgi:hypothetical protein
VIALALQATAHADKEAGLDATLGMPLAPWSNAVGPGYGGSLWLRVPAAPLVDITLRVGAMVHGDQPVPGTMAHQRLSEIPLLGGARWRALDWPVRIYFSGEVGLVWARTDLVLGPVVDSDAPIRLASWLGVDVEYDRFIVRGGVWLADLSSLDKAIGATISVGARVITW